MTKVFIGMPVYNGERFIKKSINSIINQRFTDWVLYISDDCSTDQTANICKKYANSDKRIKYYRQKENIGMFENFRFVLEKSDSPFFMWMAQDDIREPEYLYKCIEQFTEDSELDLVTSCSAGIDSFDRIISREDELVRFSGKPNFYSIYKYVMHPEILGKCNLMYGLFTKKAIKGTWDAYPQRKVWGQDYVFVLAAIARYKIKVIPEILFKKRFGGYSSPNAIDNDKPDKIKEFSIDNPKNHIFPFGRFGQYLKGHIEATADTPYKIFVMLLLLIRLPRALILHLKQKNYKKFIGLKKVNMKIKMKKIIRNIIESIIGKENYMKLWKSTIDLRRNKKREKEIQEKNASSILEYKNKYNPRIFIETGTYKGDMVNRMSDKFDKIYSIELGEKLYTNATDRFKNKKHIEIINGDSAVVLPKLLERIEEPVLFWLDAHYSTGETVRADIDTPIETELKIILNHRVKNHVIMIDDAREFVGKDGYLPLKKVEQMARESGYSFEVKQDNIRLFRE